MDRGREAAGRVLTGALRAAFALLAVGAALAANGSDPPLREARWLPAERRAHALAYRPGECLQPPSDPQAAQRVAIGRVAFRTPLLLGGQAARAGLSCDSCHRNGRGNPDFAFPGLSGAPGTADVTSSLMSSHRGDGAVNPVPIPDLAGPAGRLKIDRREDRALETFVRGLIVEEFDGTEPSPLTLDAVADYVRALSPQACAGEGELRIAVTDYLADARDAASAAQHALAARDPVAARLMLSGARHALGSIDERYVGAEFAHARRQLRTADLELAAIQRAIDADDANASVRIAAWLAAMPRWSDALRRGQAHSLFDPARLAAASADG